MRYDAILFDADGTLFDFEAAERAALARLLERLGLDAHKGREAYLRYNQACWRALENGEIDMPTLKTRRFALLAEHFGLETDVAALADFYEAALSRQSILLPGAYETVRRVAAEKKIALITNGIARVQRGRMEASPLCPLWGAILISEEIGAAKPDPLMIRLALKRLGDIPPARALVVGDSLTSDMEAARRAGVDACWINPRGEEKPDDLPIRYIVRDIEACAEIALS